MTKAYAGIFIADDKVIFGILRGNPSEATFQGDWSSRSKSKGKAWVRAQKWEVRKRRLTIEEMLDHCAAQIGEARDELPIERLVIASPGPIAEDGSIFVNHRREDLAGRNLKEIAADSFNLKPDQIAVVHDAGALAYGEYLLTAGIPLRQRPRSVTPGDTVRYRADDPTRVSDVNVLIVLDEGIGGGVTIDGRPTMGAVRSELGHMIISLLPGDESQASSCKLHHGPCVEGYASLSALRLRYGEEKSKSFLNWKADDPVLERAAYYVAQVVYNVIVSVTPKEIIFTGRMADNAAFIKKVVSIADALRQPVGISADGLEGYPGAKVDFLTSSAEKGDSGVLGCLCIAAWNWFFAGRYMTPRNGK